MPPKGKKRRTKYTKAQILEEWEKIKDLPDSELTYAYARKNYSWFSSACNIVGGKPDDWYMFLSKMGKTNEEIEAIRKSGLSARGKKEKGKWKKYSDEYILAQWEKIKDMPDEQLSYAYARKNYKWWCSACTQYGKYSTDWYGFLAAMGKSKKEIKNISKTAFATNRKFSKEEIFAEWEKIKARPHKELTLAYAQNNYEWFSSACTHFGKNKSDWYGFLKAMGKGEEEIQIIRDVGKFGKGNKIYTNNEILELWKSIKDKPLEELTYSYARKNYPWWSVASNRYGRNSTDWYGFLAAMGKTEEEIDQIKQKAKELGIAKVAASLSGMKEKSGEELVKDKKQKGKRFTREEILTKWEKIKDAPDEELTYAYARKNYDWFSSACTIFGRNGDGWYGFLKVMGKTEEEIESIREVKKKIVLKTNKSKSRYGKKEVLEKWETIKDAPDEELTQTYAQKNYDWIYSAGTHFGKDSRDWYGFLKAMGKSDENIERIKKVARKDANEMVGKRSLKFSREEVLAEWEKIKDVSDEELTHAYAQKNYDWFYSACTIFGERYHDWYGFLKAMGKSDEDIDEIREKGKEINVAKGRKTKAGKTSDGKTIVIVDAPNGNNGNGNGIDYSEVLSTVKSPEIISTKTHSTRIVRFNMSLEEKGNTTKVQNKAEEIRRMIGAGMDWNNPELVQKYKEAFPTMAPWVVHRACILYLLGMVKSGKIKMPKNILSAASGPSEVHEAITDLKGLFESQDIQMPRTYDLDLSMNMLLAGDNRKQSIGDARRIGFKSSSFDMIENSSIFQFKPADVKNILLESNRLIREGGLLFLISNGRKFSDPFYEGLVECGFELISSKDDMFDLDRVGRKLLEKAHGKEFSQKFKSALGDSVFILAKKVRDANQDVDENKFTFESFDCAPIELRQFMDEFKGFLRGLDKGDVESTNNHRRKAIEKFKDIHEKKPEILSEYSTVFSRAQAKFWSVVESPKFSTMENLDHLKSKDKPDDLVMPRIWRRLPVGKKRVKPPSAFSR